jgi:CRP/FNR family cyclic AMP-dependent transcriptional regulator
LASPIAGSGSWPETTLLARLTPSARGELVRLGGSRVFAPKSVLIRHGDAGNHVVLLTEGVVKIVVDADGGGEILLGLRVAGDLVGELAALDGRKRSASVVACTQVSAKTITKGELDGFFHRNPGAADEVQRMIIARLRSADRSRARFLSGSAQSRLAGVLVELAETYGREDERGHWVLGVALTQAELGSLAGMARRTTEKEFSRLRRDELIRVGYRDLELLDMRVLRRLARAGEPDPA